jgi:hypothetical protein
VTIFTSVTCPEVNQSRRGECGSGEQPGCDDDRCEDAGKLPRPVEPSRDGARGYQGDGDRDGVRVGEDGTIAKAADRPQKQERQQQEYRSRPQLGEQWAWVTA